MKDLRRRHSRCLAAAARLLGPLYDLFRVFNAVQGLAESPLVSGARQARWYSCQASKVIEYSGYTAADINILKKAIYYTCILAK